MIVISWTELRVKTCSATTQPAYGREGRSGAEEKPRDACEWEEEMPRHESRSKLFQTSSEQLEGFPT